MKALRREEQGKRKTCKMKRWKYEQYERQKSKEKEYRRFKNGRMNALIKGRKKGDSERRKERQMK